MKTDITTARGVQLIPFQASSTCCGPPPSSYVVNRWSPSNGGSVVSNVRKLFYAKIAKKCLVAAWKQIFRCKIRKLGSKSLSCSRESNQPCWEIWTVHKHCTQQTVGTVWTDQQQLHIQNEESVKTAIQIGMAKQTRHTAMTQFLSFLKTPLKTSTACSKMMEFTSRTLWTLW